MQNSKMIIVGCGALLVIGVLVGLLVFSGGKKPKPSKNHNVVVWTPVDKSEIFDPLVRDFKNKNKTVMLEFVHKDPATYEDDLINAIADGKGPDIFVIRNDWIPKHLNKLAAYEKPKKLKTDPVQEYRNGYIPLVPSENIIDGKMYGKPLAIDPLVLYINNSILNNVRTAYYQGKLPKINMNLDAILAQGPANWDEFMALARFSRQFSGKNIRVAGAAMGTTNNIAASVDILYLMMLQNGAKFLDDNKKNATFNLRSTTYTGEITYPGTKALEFFDSFAVPRSNNYTWNRKMPDSRKAFANNQVGMLIDYASAERYMTNLNPNLNFRKTTVPQIKGAQERVSFAKYWTFVVNKNSTSQAESWSLINYLASSNVDQLYSMASGGYLPYKRQNVGMLNGAPATVSSDLQVARGVYKPDSLAYDNIMKTAINEVIDGLASPQNALNEAAAKVTALLNRK